MGACFCTRPNIYISGNRVVTQRLEVETVQYIGHVRNRGRNPRGRTRRWLLMRCGNALIVGSQYHVVLPLFQLLSEGERE